MINTRLTTNSNRPATLLSRALVFLSIASAIASAPLHASEQSFRLLLVQNAGDVETQGECIRGQLFMVRSYDAKDVERRVHIADTLEVLSWKGGLRASSLTNGKFDGVTQESKSGWRIALVSSAAVLGAQRNNQTLQPSVLLGRSTGGAGGACELSHARLEDSEVMTQRLQHLVKTNEDGDVIEIEVRSEK